MQNMHCLSRRLVFQYILVTSLQYLENSIDDAKAALEAIITAFDAKCKCEDLTEVVLQAFFDVSVCV